MKTHRRGPSIIKRSSIGRAGLLVLWVAVAFTIQTVSIVEAQWDRYTNYTPVANRVWAPRTTESPYRTQGCSNCLGQPGPADGGREVWLGYGTNRNQGLLPSIPER